MILTDAVAFTVEGKLVRNATGQEQEKLKRAIPHRVRGLRGPSFRHPLERIGDPQISPTRLFGSTRNMGPSESHSTSNIYLPHFQALALPPPSDSRVHPT